MNTHPFSQPPPVDTPLPCLPPHTLSPYLHPLASLDTPHPLLVGRGLADEVPSLGGCIGVLTAEAARLLREAGAFKYAAAGDLVCPTYDAAGQLAGWRLWPSPSRAYPKPPRFAPSKASGWSSSGVVGADHNGRAVLLSGAGAAVDVLLIVEGEPDMLTARAWVDAFDLGAQVKGAVGVIGLYGAGAWSPELGARVSQWAEVDKRRSVFVMTDRDKAGAGYAGQVRASISAGVQVFRAGGRSGRADLNDIWKAGGYEALWALLSSSADMPAPPTVEAGRWRWSDDTAGWAEVEGWTPAPSTTPARAPQADAEGVGSLLASAVKWWGAKLGAVVSDAASGGGTHGGGWASQVLPLLRAAQALAGLEGYLDETQRDHCAAALADLAGAYESIRTAAVTGAKDAEARADRLRSLRGALAKAERQPMMLDDVLRRIQRTPFKPRSTTNARASGSSSPTQRQAQAALEAVAVEVGALSLTVARRAQGAAAEAVASAQTANEEGAGALSRRAGVAVAAEVVASSHGLPSLIVCVESHSKRWHPPSLLTIEGEGCHLSVFVSSRTQRDGTHSPLTLSSFAALDLGEAGVVEGEGTEIVEAAPEREGVEVVEACAVVEGEDVEGDVEEHGLKPAEDGGLSLRARFLPRDLFDLVGRVWRSLVLKSGQGTGKTEALVQLIEEARARGERVLILTHRRELARSLAARLGARCYLDDKGRLLIGEGGALVLCVDSLKRLVMGCRVGANLSPDLVIIDESEQVARHLFGATVGDKLSVVADDLSKVLRRAARVVCADADAGAMTLRLLVHHAGRTQGLLNVTNTWSEWGFNLNGSRRVLLLKDHSNDGRMMLIDALTDAVLRLGEGKTILVACTSITQAHEIEEILCMNGCGDGVLVVTSETKGTPAARAFLADPNGCLPRVLIYSPTIGTGVSIDREVERVFVCGAAVEGFTGPDMVQLMTRARKQRVPALVWLQEKEWANMPRTRNDARAQLERLFDEVVGHSEKAAGVSRHTRKLWRQRLAEDGLSGDSDDARLFDLLVECLAETGRTGWSNVKCTLEALTERGAVVSKVSGNWDAVESMRDEVKEAREAMKEEAACAIIEAQPLPPDTDMDELRQASTPEARAACMRHDIEGRGVEVTFDSALAAGEGALSKGRALADAAVQLKGGVVAAYVAKGIMADLRACPARLPALAGPSRAARVVEVLQAAGLECVLTQGEWAAGEAVEGWTVDLNDAKRIEAVRAYIEANRHTLKTHGFSPPETDRTKEKYKDQLVKEWLVDRLKGLGMMVERGEKLSSSQRARRKRECTLTRAAVVEAWRWAARPYAAIVDAAELDAAEWAVVGGGALSL